MPFESDDRAQVGERAAIVLSQFIRYVVVGGLSTSMHYIVLYTLHGVLGWNGALSTTLGMLLSAAFNFVANYHFTFHSKNQMADSLLRFVIVITVGVFINASIFWLLVTRLSWFYLFGQAVATVVVLFWNFLFSRSYIYASRPQIIDTQQ